MARAGAGAALILTPEPTMATKVGGVAVAAHGADNMAAGLTKLFTGKEKETLTSQGLQAAGLSKQNAEAGDAVIGIAGTGLASATATSMSKTPAIVSTASKGIEAANGTTVTGFTSHGVDRAIGSTGRLGVKPSAILDALKNPLQVKPIVADKLGRESQRLIGQFSEVVLNPGNGKIISVNPTSTKTAEKLMKLKIGL